MTAFLLQKVNLSPVNNYKTILKFKRILFSECVTIIFKFSLHFKEIGTENQREGIRVWFNRKDNRGFLSCAAQHSTQV